jgi:hypothetical protein
MADLNTASNSDLMAAIKARTDQDVAQVAPLMEKLIEILHPETSILQQGPYAGGARAVHQACSAFINVHSQLTKAQATAASKS